MTTTDRPLIIWMGYPQPVSLLSSECRSKPRFRSIIYMRRPVGAGWRVAEKNIGNCSGASNAMGLSRRRGRQPPGLVPASTTTQAQAEGQRIDPNFVLLASTAEVDMPFGAAEEQIRTAATHYLTLCEKAVALAGEAPDKLLSGGSSSVYLKKLGHRPLTAEDVAALINALGTDADKDGLTQFKQAQDALTERLQRTKNIGLVLGQAGVPYDQFYKRTKRTDLWKPEQMTAIVEVLRRLQV
jgi:hypothetical protein